MKFDKEDKVVKAPDALNSPLYKLTKAVVKAAKLRNSLVGTKEEVLAKAAKMNAKNRHFIMPTDGKAHYTDHLIQGRYHCVETIRNAGAKCVIHVGKGMHHCYALQYFIPGCKPAFDEVMRLIQNYFKKVRSQ